MDGILLLLPILVPILGGLAVLGIHNMKTRRLTVTLLLVFQIFVVLEVVSILRYLQKWLIML